MRWQAALLRHDYSASALADHHREVHERALEPDAYAEVGLQCGGRWHCHTSDVMTKTKNPVWDPRSPTNTAYLPLPADGRPTDQTSEQVVLYVHMLDNNVRRLPGTPRAPKTAALSIELV